MINETIFPAVLQQPKITRILVVEDEPTLSVVLCEFLRIMNFEVICAENGVEALDRMCLSSFDLIITDVMMPKMGGLELIQNIRKVKPFLPIIAVTGSDYDTAVELQDNFTKALRKPYAFDTLLSKIYQFEIVYAD
ncbi:response regulator [bacterium]|nr:response regulator [bacterium]